jgi:ABC-type multidrug transport system ATPase subunit
VRHADQTVVMDKGRVAEVGTHAQLMRRGGIYAALVRRQAGAVLDQERDLAPHERQQGDDGGSSSDGASQSPAAAAAAAASGQQQDDSLAQWRQQPRVKDADDDAA